MNNKCKDFEVCPGNSDAECFFDNDDWDDYSQQKNKIEKNPSICDICVYNEKHKHHNYESWKEYRKEIGIPPKQ